jgi:uncharacterized protein YyaL (SSP411 family)
MDDNFCEILSQTIINLHMWRMGYNGSHIGSGYDQYSPDKICDYPEAYALWGNGYLYLYLSSKEEKYLDISRSCANWLIENRSPSYKHYAWGLPWEWEGRPKDTAYITTSTFVGNFFLDIYEMTFDKKYLKICREIAQWIIEENGYTDDEGAWFNYSDHSSLTYPIFNAISMASGFLARLTSYCREPQYENLSKRSAYYTLKFQQETGSWNYSTKSKVIDNVHTGYTIEGLCDTYQALGLKEEYFENALSKAASFYKCNLYKENGYGYEKVHPDLREKIIFKLFNRKTESRLHGYAAGIRAFTKLQTLFKEENFGESIARYIDQNLKLKNGAFKFRMNDESLYIRNEAQVFHALTFLYLKLNLNFEELVVH